MPISILVPLHPLWRDATLVTCSAFHALKL